MARSTFIGYYQAYSGLQAAQLGLDVTGQNITNMNTEDYTRQRLEQVALPASGSAQWAVKNEVKVGQGVLVTDLTQIRDDYLDARYRGQLANVGTTDAMNEVMDLIGGIFDDVDDNMIEEALDDVVKQLQSLSSKVGEEGYDTAVRSSVQVLVNYIHQAASELNDVRTDLEFKLSDSVVPDINSTLESIKNLNISIRNTEIMGNSASELKDQRAALLDDLATYFDINVSYEDVSIGSGYSVETMKITFEGADGNTYTLIDDDQVGSVELEYGDDGSISGLTLTDAYGNVKEGLDQNNLSDGVLKGDFQMLNCMGSVDGSNVNGIGYYQALLDSFAYTLATGMNDLNNPDGGTSNILFTSSDGGTINALNLQVSDEWISGEAKIIASTDMLEDNVEGTTDNDIILQMKNFLSTDKMDFYYVTSEGVDKSIVLYNGTMPGAYSNLQTTYGVDAKSIAANLDNKNSVLSSIYDAKDAISGVNLDEEVMNLLKYAQSYNAAAKVMSVMDEVLTTLISNTF